MDTRQAQQLLEKYRSGNCSPEEKALLEQWYFKEAAKLPMPDAPIDPAAEEALIWNRINRELFPETKVRRLPVRKWAAIAASVLFFLTAGIYFYSTRHTKPNDTVVLKASDIKGGGNNAILTLANGTRINLSNSANGLIAKQAGLNIIKAADGSIIYSQSNSAAESKEALAYNTIETPIGFTSVVNLPDGSKVWLNAASSIKYPVVFKGKERLVELTGEAYFEVIHHTDMPFKVKTAGQLVEDLGTHFNINAYGDEPGIKTTLLEGSVSVTSLANNTIQKIVPGQQASLNGENLTVKNVNTSLAVAWKNGLFEFDHTDLHTLMRQIGRWYNLQIVYEGNVKDDQFFGEVERKYDLAEVLKVLELGGLHFRVEGTVNGSQQKKLIVMP